MFANIIVDISVENLDRTFQYKIPETMEKDAQVGVQVEIPFGNGNRMIQGFILELTEKALFPVERIKSIQRVLTGNTVVESQMIQLAAFIRKEYGGTMNEALKTVLPVKKQVKSVEDRQLSFAVEAEKIEEYIVLCEKRHYVAKERLLKGMIENKGLLSERVARERYQASKAVVDGLVKVGLIRVDTKRIFRNPVKAGLEEKTNLVLNEQQQTVVERFMQDQEHDVQKTYLLHGITGSGKTEVYLRMMQQVISKGKQVIVLIPEIALTKQTVSRFQSVFGERVSILNSRMSFGERFDQYERAKTGQVDIVVGPRMALFVPFAKLGLIVVDEEHENSYKSDSTPKYHAREVAVYRGRLAGASVVLGSATPSVEAYEAAKQGRYELLQLTKRAGEGSLPQVEVVDLREELKAKNRSIFSRELQKRMAECLQNGQQMMLFINRRGYAGFVSCRSCGNVIKCPHCDVSLTEHKDLYGNPQELVCHYCGHVEPMPEKCPDCGSPFIASFGIGTQKVEQMVRKLFPTARTLRMDADTTTGKDGHERVLNQFRQGQADILIGTQMIVKGHDFPGVTLVGILAADLSMYGNDYRCSERTFQLLMQAAGRAGRGALAGSVVIQTYNPEHYCVQAVAHHSYDEFYENEMAFRRMLKYPPVWHVMAVMVQSKEEKRALTDMQKLHNVAKKVSKDRAQVIGPAKANLYKKNDWYRYMLYIKAAEKDTLIAIRQRMEESSENMSVQYDNNPQSGY